VAKSFSSSLSYSWNTTTGTKTKGGGKKPKAPTATTHAIQVLALDPAGNKATKSISVSTQ
jgi:hypothetical protein